MNRLLWITPEKSGGIRSYSDALWKSVAGLWSGVALDPLFELPTTERLRELTPDIIHIQHEFGLFGSKIPPFYRFPSWLRDAKKALPQAKFVATAHTVLDAHYVYPVENRGWQTPLRWIANQALLPLWRKAWREETWGRLDGVIVHSGTQVQSVREAGCSRVVEIPHFVFEAQPAAQLAAHDGPPRVVVFGFITPEKGQDVAIQALARVNTPSLLILAGGARRGADERFLERCKELIARSNLSSKVKITGFVSPEDVSALFESADLVVAPFRETSGSGSIAQALGRGCAILASDLELNGEIGKRQPGSLAFFKSESPEDLAAKIDQLLGDLNARRILAENALLYAKKHSVERIAAEHIEFYRSFKV